MPDGHFSRDGRRRLLMVALGRQRVGKTALLNTIVQYFRAEGNEIEVWNADQQNRTHSLSTFFSDARVPPEGGLVDAGGWIESKLKHQAEHGYHAVLDAGGGLTGFSALVETVPVIAALAAQGTDVIGLFCVGPEQADLDYLDTFSSWGGAAVSNATALGVNPSALAATCVAESGCQNVRGSGTVAGAFQMTASTYTAMINVAHVDIAAIDAEDMPEAHGQLSKN